MLSQSEKFKSFLFTLQLIARVFWGSNSTVMENEERKPLHANKCHISPPTLFMPLNCGLPLPFLHAVMNCSADIPTSFKKLASNVSTFRKKNYIVNNTWKTTLSQAKININNWESATSVSMLIGCQSVDILRCPYLHTTLD